MFTYATEAAKAIQIAEATSQTRNRPDFQFMSEAFEARQSRRRKDRIHSMALADNVPKFLRRAYRMLTMSGVGPNIPD